ncbi:unknown [Firmicutes bacterium CAG:646]|nr:unknown [Firmicutes bacterium CAG:646]
MEGNIAFQRKAFCNRHHGIDHVFLKIAVKCSNLVISGSHGSRIKACQRAIRLCRIGTGSVKQRFSRGIQNQNTSILIFGKKFQIVVRNFRIVGIAVIRICLIGGNGDGFFVESFSGIFQNLILDNERTQRGNHQETCHTQKNVSHDKFEIKSIFHQDLTSNLYPIPQTVLKAQEA